MRWLFAALLVLQAHPAKGGEVRRPLRLLFTQLRPRHLLRGFPAYLGDRLRLTMIKMAHRIRQSCSRRTIRALLLSVIDQERTPCRVDVRHLPHRLQDGHKRDGVPVLHRYLRKPAAHDCLCDSWID